MSRSMANIVVFLSRRQLEHRPTHQAFRDQPIGKYSAVQLISACIICTYPNTFGSTTLSATEIELHTYPNRS
jgi:hypothetical protein